ncbi:hypothetical protein SBW85_04930 [Vibrio plantisponsor]|uniref:Uncharacterized protein n=1 Tax=Vibrio plantisponsor TaxID=664643 RepID=A0ABU4IEZ1_9VIBR|nr:hypothetical protein [Vibrio plantisponsor]MDW6017118.1 hypothetical protein [Vibrio plantisponsor]
MADTAKIADFIATCSPKDQRKNKAILKVRLMVVIKINNIYS